MQSPRKSHPILLFLALGPLACGEKDVDVSEHADMGDTCDPQAAPDAEAACFDGLACQPVADSQDFVCAAPLEIRGMVVDASSQEPIEGAHVGGLDESGAPVADVAVTDATGAYVLHVTAVRSQDGALAEDLKWTLVASAADYQPFPAGVRPSIPIDGTTRTQEPIEGTEDGAGEVRVMDVIENPSTTVALIPLPEGERGGATVSGTVAAGAGAGTLVIAEGQSPAPSAIADAAGHYTLFNVGSGAHTVRGYRTGLELEAAEISVEGSPVEGVDLGLITDIPEELATVSGTVNIVNAPGESATSVVLVPTSVFNEPLERGPVPLGLRAPEPPLAVDVNGGFAIPGVPAGSYKVLAAFENDRLVRDPDESIAGTAIQEITVDPGAAVEVEEGFKVTEALAVLSPGADIPEVVSAPPTFVWEDDSSEDRYDLMVFDALGELVWRDENVPAGNGSQVEHAYGGPALTPGMYYQFRATSYRETPQGSFAISRTEDLLGVFVYEGE